MSVRFRQLITLKPLQGIDAGPGPSDDDTYVVVNSSYPHLALKGRHCYWFTTEPQFLDPGGFPDRTQRRNIRLDANKARRRALFCVDRRCDKVLAAISFHVDDHPDAPLLVTDVAVRCDHLQSRGIFALWMLLDVLQDVALVMPKRADFEVGMWGKNNAECQRWEGYGLKKCGEPKRLVNGDTWYCYKRSRPRIIDATRLIARDPRLRP